MNIEENKNNFFEKYEIVKKQPMKMTIKLWKIIQEENKHIDADHAVFYKNVNNSIIMVISPYANNVEKYIKRNFIEIPTIYNNETMSFIKYFIKGINI